MTKAKTSAAGLAGMALAAALALGASSAAQAHGDDDISWSIGMSSPGVQIGVSNGAYPPVFAPVVVHAPPQRVVVLPRPVVYHGHPQHRWQARHGERHEYHARHQRRDRHDRFEGHGRGGRDDHARMGGGRGQPQPQARGEAHMGNRR